jgi:hypothetical protein
MSFSFPCPICGSTLMVGEEVAGQRFPCPDCGVTVAAPVGASSLAAKRFRKRILVVGAASLGILVISFTAIWFCFPDLLQVAAAVNDTPTPIAIRNKRYAEEGTLRKSDRLSKPGPMIGSVREVRLRKGICYRLSLRAETFDPRLIVMDAEGHVAPPMKGQKIDNQADVEILPGSDGDWRIVITSADGSRVGDFQFEITISEERSLPTLTVTGQLAAEDRVDAPRPMVGRVHRRMLTKGREYTFKTVARGFEPFTLIVEPKSHQVLRETSPLLPNALLFFSPPEDGEYEIVVSSIAGDGIGNYDLQIREWEVD